MENINAQFGVEEKLWFEIQQPLLLWMCQHEEGRKLLCLDQTLERIDIIRPSSVSMYLGDGMMRTDFRTRSKWANLIRFQWNWFQQIADEYAFLMNLGRVPFISEPVVQMAATTSTFYPAAGEVSGWDSIMTRTTNGTWSQMRDGAGEFDNVSIEIIQVQFGSQSTSGQYDYMSRTIILFDTSDLGGDTIDSAILSLYISKKNMSFTGISPAINIFASTPASTSLSAPSDYGNIGTTEFSTNIAYASITTSAYNAFSLNASGLAAIDGAGISKYGWRESVYDAPDNEPTWEQSKFVYVNAYSADTAGTTSDPKLVVDHTLAFTPRAIMF